MINITETIYKRFVREDTGFDRQPNISLVRATAQKLDAWLTRWISPRAKSATNILDVDIASIGVDSLEAVQLVCDLERELAHGLPETLLWDSATIGDFVQGVIRHIGTAAKCKDSAGSSAVKDISFRHRYGQYINPYLGRKLEQIKLDKTFVKGQGCYIYDQYGYEYLDFMSQYGALPFGHHPQQIWDAIRELELDKEPIFAQPSLLHSAGLLAEQLIAIAPGNLAYATFTNSGAESIEAAIKMCRQRTGRNGILATLKGFHGKTLGALSATGKREYQAPFGLPLPEFDHVPYGDSEALAFALAQTPHKYAAFIVEPIQGEGGVVEPPLDYLRRAKEICARYGVLFVVDEVQTGLGRTGAMFASEYAQVQPDVLTLAKALGGGVLPIGACLCTKEIYSEKFALKHSSTFAGNAIAARAGLATLAYLERNERELLRNASVNGELLKARLAELARRYPAILSGVSGRGYMLGVRFGVTGEHWPETFLGAAAGQHELAQLVASYLLNAERIRVAPTLNQSQVIRVQPPLIATAVQCERFLAAFERAIELLATGDTGLIYGSILNRQPRITVSNRSAEPRLPAGIRSASLRFAFLIHPLDAQSYVDYDKSLAKLSKQELGLFVDSMDGFIEPFVSSTVTVTSETGQVAVGDFILISRTARMLTELPEHEVLEEIGKALDVAKKRGAQIVGLGAYTSVVSKGGLKLRGHGIPLTSGNSYTVVAGVNALSMALKRIGLEWRDVTVAIVGGAGAIGSAIATLLTPLAARIILVGNPNGPSEQGKFRLRRCVANICRVITEQEHAELTTQEGPIIAAINRIIGDTNLHSSEEDFLRVAEVLECEYGLMITTSSRHAVIHADVVVIAVSDPQAIMSPQDFRPGAVVCDISRPRAIASSVAKQRPDILVIDGGLIALPGKPHIGSYGIEPGLSYACMAETMLLALEGDSRSTSLGPELSIAEILRQRRVGEKHGFLVSELQSFGRPIADQDWQCYLDARAEMRNARLAS